MKNIENKEVRAVNLNTASKLLNINRGTLYTWIREGIIRKEMYGKSPMIPMSEINKILNKF